MNSEREQRIKEIFADALERADPQARAAYLAEACGTDLELRKQVESLLTVLERSGDFLQKTLVVPSKDVMGEGPGTAIGRYKLLQEIGEGGFGRVFMAEQQEPVRRKVALKIIKMGMDTREVIARFEAERQALALMDHPNIARVLDAGATDTGRPYFVMELVKGIPITTYCDEHNLNTAERLQLFMHVCRAVQHAHQKGIIHRDLKPTNVLVTVVDGEAVPKVIDFGIAKAMGQELTNKTLFTRFEQMVGTPAYMSPEQAALSGVDVDTRSDIYSLGVLLYELLTGVTPFDKETLAKAAFDEIRRMIQETEPPKPSTRLTQLDQTPHSALHTPHFKEVRGDLDWIVMKALEKDRGRRYETANDFAEDIERHLQHEPVAASPPSTVYRARKFVRRNRVPVAIAGSVTVALLVGLSMALVVLQRALKAETEARRERDRAAQAEANAETVLGFFQDKVLRATRPEGIEGGLGRQVTMKDTLDAAEPTIAFSFTNQPLIEARIRQVLGHTYYYLGESKQAVEQQERSQVLFATTLGSNHLHTLNSLSSLGQAYDAAGRPQEAIPILEGVLQQYRTWIDAKDTETELTIMHRLAGAYYRAGRLQEALALHEELLQQTRTFYGRDHERTLYAMNNLANALISSGFQGKALSLLEEAHKGLKAALGSNNPNTLVTMGTIAEVYCETGRWDEGLLLFEETLAALKDKLGPVHPYTLRTIEGLGNAQGRLGYWHNALERFQTLVSATPENPEFWYVACAAAAAARETNLVLTLTQGMVSRFGGNQNERTCRLLARTLMMLPASSSHLEPAAKLTAMLPTDKPGSLGNRTTKGILEYRRGQWLETTKWLDEPRRSPNQATGCLADYFTAMAWHQLGDQASARRVLDDASQKLGTVLQRGDLGAAWPDLAHNLVVRAEAEQVVLGRQVSPPVTPESLSAARRAELSGRLGDWKNCADQFARLLAAGPTDHWLGYTVAPALVLAGSTNGYQSLCADLVARFGETTNGAVAERIARSLVILPGSTNLEAALRLADSEIRRHPKNRWGRLAKGMVEYRLGNWTEAVRWLDAPATDPFLPMSLLAGCFKAMALYQLGQPDPARAALDNSNQGLDGILHRGDLNPENQGLWHDYARILIARAEAERLILGREVSPPVTQQSLAAARELLGQAGRK